MTEKLPVFATLAEAIRCVRRYGGRVWPYVVGLSIIFLAIAVGCFLLGLGGALIGRMEGVSPHPWVGLIVFAAMTVFFLSMLPISNSLQRLVVQGPEARVGFAYGREEWLMLRTVLKVCLIAMGIMLAVMIPIVILLFTLTSAQPQFAAFAMLPLAVVMMFLMVRWAPVFPAAANGRKMTLREGFRLTRGNGWRVFWLLFWGNIIFSLLQNAAKLLVPVSPVAAGATSLIVMMLAMLFSPMVTALAYVRLEGIASRGEPKTVE